MKETKTCFGKQNAKSAGKHIGQTVLETFVLTVRSDSWIFLIITDDFARSQPSFVIESLKKQKITQIRLLFKTAVAIDRKMTVKPKSAAMSIR